MKQPTGVQVIQCTISRQKPVKAAVVVFGDHLEVIHDPQLVTENIAAVMLTAGNLKIGVLSIYLEPDKDIEPYLRDIHVITNKLQTQHIILGGDVNAWSHWWGSKIENRRGEQYSAFLNDIEYQILNKGNTSTFETYRGNRLYESIVDVTACSLPMVERTDDWRVDKSITSSDHNAITFRVRLDKVLEPLRPTFTRIYNTKKAKWSEFRSNLKSNLAQKSLKPHTVSEVNCPRELEKIIATYIAAIHEACTNSIPKLSARRSNTKPIWWTSSLEDLKRDVLRKKRRIRNAAPKRKNFVIEEYMQAKQNYSTEAANAATKSWKEFCSTQDRESMWDGIYRVLRKTAKRHEDMLLRNNQGHTLSPQASADLLASTFYPEDSMETDQEHHTLLRRLTMEKNPEKIDGLTDDDPPFTISELNMILHGLNPKKAPGPDGLTSDICTAAIQCDGELFLAIANKCLALQHFPDQWKVAHVCILRKPGKEDYTQPKSYRPIGLLSVMGKIIEKLLVGRLQWRLLPKLHRNQYGFTPQRGTEDALYDLVEHIRTEVKEKKVVLLISLDIEGAFDNAWWPAVKAQLIEKGCPKNIYGFIVSYLSQRKINVNYARATSERETTKGCVQGSVAGPTFWNLILDSLLQKLANQGIHVQAFADDVALVISNKSVQTIEHTATNILAMVSEWGAQNKLRFAPHKTNAMVITNKRKYDTPVIYMSDVRLQLVKEMKLLGLTIDHKLNFNAHVSNTCRKAADIYKQLACAAKIKWGLNKEVIRTIYVAVVEPIVLYAASVWAPAAEKTKIKKQLNALQRGFAQKICKSYRTVSLTSALALSGQIPLDLRVQEAAALFKIRKGYSQEYLPPGREMERRLGPLQNPHPSLLKTTEYDKLEELSPNTTADHQTTGSQIYTDGSKIDGKTGAALTWWQNGRETSFSTFRLEPHNTVFQSELYALFRAIRMARKSKERLINIMSDSRSSLDLLKNPSVTHPLALEIKEDLRAIDEENRKVRLFWLKAHVGTPGNERADELAKTAALNLEVAPDYDKVPISYIRKMIRQDTSRKWQERYEASSTGSVTKAFFPTVLKAREILKKEKLTSAHVQAMTGHGGFAAYLHRFKIKDSPSCLCEPDVDETIWHLLFECPRFGRIRNDLEIMSQMKLNQSTLPQIMESKSCREPFMEFISKVVSSAAAANGSTLYTSVVPQTQTYTQPRTPQRRRQTTTHIQVNSETETQTHTQSQTNAQSQTQTHTPTQSQTSVSERPSRLQQIPPIITTPYHDHLLTRGEKGNPSIRLRPVPLFMNSTTERLGISFCQADARHRVELSPGVAVIINGSTSKTSVKRDTYLSLPIDVFAGQPCRVVQSNNKTIVLLEWGTETPFEQACSALTRLGDMRNDTTKTPRVISVDAMAIGYQKGRAADHYGCVKASANHEVIIYSNRGEDLSFLIGKVDDATPAAPSGSSYASTIKSQAECLQEKLHQKAVEKRERAKDHERQKKSNNDHYKFLVEFLKNTLQKPDYATINRQGSVTERFLRTSPSTSKQSTPKKTRAHLGQVSPPKYRPVKGTEDHKKNAFIEFLALTRALIDVKLLKCKNIICAYQQNNQKLLGIRLEEANAAIYDNDGLKVVTGEMSGQYMAAYSATNGFVNLDEEGTRRTGKARFDVPSDDAIVVVADCTRIMLEDRILMMAQAIIGDLAFGVDMVEWAKPSNFTWVNGVPGCGKTAWIVENFNEDDDVIITTTTEAAKDLRLRLSQHYASEEKTKVRTMASVLVNGSKTKKSHKRLLVDEALMNHFGSIIMAAKLTGVDDVVLIGDINQLPFIERENVFVLRYNRPNLVTNISQELSCTHRCPMDVAYALRMVYKNIYSSNERVRSLKVVRYAGVTLPKDAVNTLYLVYTQEEKKSLTSQGYGSGSNSRVLTIHESQGLTFESVMIMQTRSDRLSIHDSIPHAIVALSRHTSTCVYYTNCYEDAIAKTIRQTMNASDEEIFDHNIRMAVRDRNDEMVKNLIKRAREQSL